MSLLLRPFLTTFRSLRSPQTAFGETHRSYFKVRWAVFKRESSTFLHAEVVNASVRNSRQSFTLTHRSVSAHEHHNCFAIYVEDFYGS